MYLQSPELPNEKMEASLVPLAHSWINKKIWTDNVGFLVTARFPEIDCTQVLAPVHLADRAEGTIGLRWGHSARDVAA